jgi:hypothetical protein
MLFDETPLIRAIADTSACDCREPSAGGGRLVKGCRSWQSKANYGWEGEAKGPVYLYIYVYYYIHIPMFIHVDIIYLHIKIA